MGLFELFFGEPKKEKDVYDKIFDEECKTLGLTKEEIEDCKKSGISPEEWLEENESAYYKELD